MGMLQCVNCGSQTNTAVCNHLYPYRPDGKANECYLRWVNNRWEKGCEYDNCTGFFKHFADDLLKMQEKDESDGT